MNSETYLIDFFEQQYLAERQVSRVHGNNYRSKIALFSDFLRRHATIGDLNKQNINAWLMHQEKLGKAPKTLKGSYRGMILALWTLAYQNELIDNAPRGIRVYKVPRRTPDAWTHEEMQKILEACSHRKLMVRRIKATQYNRAWGQYLRAFILFDYDTALRLGDVLKIRRADIRPDGSFVILQQKTGTEIVRHLSPMTVEAIDALYMPEFTDPLFGFLDYSALRLEWRRMLTLAGLPTTYRDGPQKLRRTSVSHLESIAPGTAQYHLGHLTPGLAARHYIDPRVAKVNVPLPPSIGGPTNEA